MRTLALLGALLVISATTAGYLLIGFSGAALTACAGTAARDEVLLPAMQLAWPGVRADVERGVSGDPDGALVLAAADQMEMALDIGDRAQIAAVDWPALRHAALLGIQRRIDEDGVSEGVARSLIRRVEQFDAAWLKVGG